VKKILYTISLSAILLATSFSIMAAGEPVTSRDIAKWTVMYYLCCDNHASYEADKIVANLTKVGSSRDFNLIVLKDGDQIGDSALYYIEEGEARNLNSFHGWPEELDSSDPNTLLSFIKLVKQEYPAEHYALIILSDYGSGWQGICHDANVKDKETPSLMSIPSFADALKKATSDGDEKIDVLGLMPCVMGMIEVAYEIAPYVNYMVASEEHMLEELDKGPEYTWPYLETTWNLKNNTDMNPEDFAISIVNHYKPCDFPLWVFYGYMVLVKKGKYGRFTEILSNLLTRFFNRLRNPSWHIVSLHTTLSAVNLSKIDKVSRAVDNLSSLLILNKYSDDIKNAISYARSRVREYGKLYVKNRATVIYYIDFPLERFAFNSFVDLYDLVRLINESTDNRAIGYACEDVVESLENSIIANKVMPHDNSYGLSIYFPEHRRYYNRYIWGDEIPSSYENLRFSQDTHWDDFLREYLGIYSSI